MADALVPRLKYISVKLVKGTNLAPKDSNGLSDPFVIISFKRNGKEHDKKEKSGIVKKTLNPEWHETFSWPVLGDTPLTDNDSLYAQCWDDEYVSFEAMFSGCSLIKNDFEGEVEIKLGNVPANTVLPPIKLQPRAGKKDVVSGDLYFEITYSSSALAATKVGSSDVEKEFVEPIWEGRWADIFKSFHAELSDVEQPIFIARMNLYKATLGHCIGSDGFNANKGVSYQGGHKLSTDAKALMFERGKIEVKYLDAQLIGFTIESSPVPEGTLIVNGTPLFERALVFWQMFMDMSVAQDKVYGLLSEELKHSLNQENFGKMRAEFHKPGTGNTLSVIHAPGATTTGPAELVKGESGTWELKVVLHVCQEVDVSIRPEGKRTFPAEVSFAVAGWRVILLGFSASTNRNV